MCFQHGIHKLRIRLCSLIAKKVLDNLHKSFPDAADSGGFSFLLNLFSTIISET